jgi:hypothetical protein
MPKGELSESKGHPYIPWSSLLQPPACIRLSFSHIKNILTYFESPDLGPIKQGSNRISPVAPVSHHPWSWTLDATRGWMHLEHFRCPPAPCASAFIPGLRHAACPPMSLAYLAAARGEDAANRRRQRRERVPPGSPQGVSGDCALASPTLKWRLKCLSMTSQIHSDSQRAQ